MSTDSNITQYKGGVLLIGSLLWQNSLETGDDLRKNWRDASLSIEKKIQVLVPIRYGRKSKNGIYTMTFSNSCKNKLGKAFFVPFKTNNVKDLDSFNKELTTLAIAEGMKGKLVAGEKIIWSAVTILINSKNNDALKIESIKKWWINRFANEKVYDLEAFKIGEEDSAVKENGILNISWPKTTQSGDQDIFDDFDFIIATATVPTNYPNYNDLLKSILNDKDRKYFVNNNKNQIQTFQDEKILEKLEKS